MEDVFVSSDWSPWKGLLLLKLSSISSVTFFLKRFIRQTVYTRCTRTNCKIVPVTNSNRYVQYGASGKGVVEIQM